MDELVDQERHQPDLGRRVAGIGPLAQLVQVAMPDQQAGQTIRGARP